MWPARAWRSSPHGDGCSKTTLQRRDWERTKLTTCPASRADPHKNQFARLPCQHDRFGWSIPLHEGKGVRVTDRDAQSRIRRVGHRTHGTAASRRKSIQVGGMYGELPHPSVRAHKPVRPWSFPAGTPSRGPAGPLSQFFCPNDANHICTAFHRAVQITSAPCSIGPGRYRKRMLPTMRIAKGGIIPIRSVIRMVHLRLNTR